MRVCIFCGGCRLTREHIIPLWLTGSLRGNADKLKHDIEHLSSWIAVNLDFKSKYVCKTCNTGWMSQLEDTAKPILAPLVRGLSSKLSFEAKKTIATWSVKTMMAVMTVANPARFPPGEWAPEIRGLRPPPACFVWLASYGGAHAGWVCPRIMSVRFDEYQPETRAELCTIALGRLVVQVLGFSPQGPHPVDSGGVIQIWPSPPVPTATPALPMLSDDDLAAFANRFDT